MAFTLRCFASQNNRQHNKVVAYDIIEGSLNGERYANFLEDKLIPECNKPMHFLMDNVPFHKTHAVTELIKEHKHTPLYSVPYVPERCLFFAKQKYCRNPIENIFSIIPRSGKELYESNDKTYFIKNKRCEQIYKC